MLVPAEGQRQTHQDPPPHGPDLCEGRPWNCAVHQFSRPVCSKSIPYPHPHCSGTGSLTVGFTRGAHSSSRLLRPPWTLALFINTDSPAPSFIPSFAQSSSAPNRQGPPWPEKSNVVLETLHPLSYCPVLFFSGSGCTCPGSGSHPRPPLPFPLTIPSTSWPTASSPHGPVGLGHPPCSSSPSGHSLSPSPSSLSGPWLLPPALPDDAAWLGSSSCRSTCSIFCLWKPTLLLLCPRRPPSCHLHGVHVLRAFAHHVI